MAGAVTSLVADANNHMPGLSLEAVALESGEAAPHALARPRPVDASPLRPYRLFPAAAIWYFDVITIRHHHQLAGALVKETAANSHEYPHGALSIGSIQLPSVPHSDRSAIAVSSRPR